ALASAQGVDVEPGPSNHSRIPSRARLTPLASMVVMDHLAARRPPAELLHELPSTARSTLTSTSKPTSLPASDPGPFLRGLYTGAAKILAQSNGKSHIAW